MRRLWLSHQPLVVASRSRARVEMLKAAGVQLDVDPADLDERAIEAIQKPQMPAPSLATLLAQAKAAHVSARRPGRLVLGCDQTLEFQNKVVNKAESLDEARTRLMQMAGQTHLLHSSFCFVRDGQVQKSGVSSVEMKARRYSDSFVEAYLEACGPAALGSVGAYEVENLGIHLFDGVRGDWFTILGLPLAEVLAYLRASKMLLE